MNKVPYHLGIIIDGNRRWAKERKLPSIEGHRRGLEKVKKIGKWCREKGVKILTLFTFSTENWSRPKREVNYLIKLLSKALDKKNIEEIHRDGIKFKVIGQKERFPEAFQKRIKEAEALTKDNRKGILNIALSYGGRAEIINALKEIIRKGVSINKINENLVEQHLWTSGEPYPELIIRTGGEQRLSNFLIWQAAYSELYFPRKYWPDFTEGDLDKAFEEYVRRQRRFGK